MPGFLGSSIDEFFWVRGGGLCGAGRASRCHLRGEYCAACTKPRETVAAPSTPFPVRHTSPAGLPVTVAAIADAPEALAPQKPARHRAHEDMQALLTGTLFVALGLILFRHTGLLTGGTAGLAFLIHYATGWNFSLVFFALSRFTAWLINAWAWCSHSKPLRRWRCWRCLPSGYRRGSLSVRLPPDLPPWPVACSWAWAWACCFATGPAWGFNVLVLFLQERSGWRAGQVKMAFDPMRGKPRPSQWAAQQPGAQGA